MLPHSPDLLLYTPVSPYTLDTSYWIIVFIIQYNCSLASIMALMDRLLHYVPLIATFLHPWKCSPLPLARDSKIRQSLRAWTQWWRKKTLCTVIIKPGLLFSIYGNRVNSFHFFLCDFQPNWPRKSNLPRTCLAYPPTLSPQPLPPPPTATTWTVPINRSIYSLVHRTCDNALTWYIFCERSVS